MRLVRPPSVQNPSNVTPCSHFEPSTFGMAHHCVTSVLPEQNWRTEIDRRMTSRGRPRHETTSPLGQLILTAMKLLGLRYEDVAAESKRLAQINNNPQMTIGKSTLGNIISGSIRQPGTAKLDSLRIILNLSHTEIDAATGLHPQQLLQEQLNMVRARTREVSPDAVTRQRK